MKKLLFIGILLFVINISNAQKGKQIFQIGWYQLLEGARTKVLNDLVPQSPLNVHYSRDEVLLIFDVKDNLGYAIDIDGRIVLINNMSKVKRITKEGRVIKILNTFQVSLNKKFDKGNNLWLVGFDSAKETAKVLLSTGEIIEIPQSSYIDIKEHFDRLGATKLFFNVEDN